MAVGVKKASQWILLFYDLVFNFERKIKIFNRWKWDEVFVADTDGGGVYNMENKNVFSAYLSDWCTFILTHSVNETGI